MAASGTETTTLAYGDLPDQVGDLSMPSGADGPLPVIMLVHGGFWREPYRRDTLAPVAADLVGRGHAVWNVEYRRVGPSGGGHPETTQDVLAAFDAIPRLSGALDPVAGHGGRTQRRRSPGAVARRAAPTRRRGVAGGGRGPAWRGVGGDRVRRGAGLPARRRRRRSRRCRPRARLVPVRAPTLLVHGDADAHVPIRQSERYLAAATEAGDRCELLQLPGTDHFEVIHPGSDAWRRTLERWPA